MSEERSGQMVDMDTSRTGKFPKNDNLEAKIDIEQEERKEIQ